MDTARPTWSAAPDDYAADAGFVSALAGPVLGLLGDVDGQQVLDLGCGEGSVAAAVARVLRPGGATAWLPTFVGALEPACRGRFEAVVADATTRAEAVLADRDGVFSADYVRVRVLAYHPA